jgi:hypothetical protein
MKCLQTWTVCSGRPYEHAHTTDLWFDRFEILSPWRRWAHGLTQAYGEGWWPVLNSTMGLTGSTFQTDRISIPMVRACSYGLFEHLQIEMRFEILSAWRRWAHGLTQAYGEGWWPVLNSTMGLTGFTFQTDRISILMAWACSYGLPDHTVQIWGHVNQ